MAGKGVEHLDDGTCMMRFDVLWARVKRWARINGHKYDSSHVEGVGAI